MVVTIKITSGFKDTMQTYESLDNAKKFPREFNVSLNRFGYGSDHDNRISNKLKKFTTYFSL